MKRLRFIGILLALLLISSGIMGFGYLIKIDGAGPEISWGFGMGPFIIGIQAEVAARSIKVPKKKSSYISLGKEGI